MNLSKHPYDLFCHFSLCFIAIFFGWATWFVVVFVSIMVEYEQKSQVYYNNKNWRDYFYQDSLGDLIADGMGIGIALLIKGI